MIIKLTDALGKQHGCLNKRLDLRNVSSKDKLTNKLFEVENIEMGLGKKFEWK